MIWEKFRDARRDTEHKRREVPESAHRQYKFFRPPDAAEYNVCEASRRTASERAQVRYRLQLHARAKIIRDRGNVSMPGLPARSKTARCDTAHRQSSRR